MNYDSSAVTAENLEHIYHSKIPISKHMGLKVISFEHNRLLLGAPLYNNINHQESVFGGSLFSIAALAGWGILQLKMSQLGISANTVIAGGEVGYSAPVFSDFICMCSLPEGDKWIEFEQKLKNSGKGSVRLSSVILSEGRTCMNFDGNYVLSIG